MYALLVGFNTRVVDLLSTYDEQQILAGATIAVQNTESNFVCYYGFNIFFLFWFPSILFGSYLIDSIKNSSV
jgi:hypothetical protein